MKITPGTTTQVALTYRLKNTIKGMNRINCSLLPVIKISHHTGKIFCEAIEYNHGKKTS